MKKTRKFGSREGATFIEYALLAGLVAIVVAAAAMIFGDDLKQLFGSTGKQASDVSEQVEGVNLIKTLQEAQQNNNSGE